MDLGSSTLISATYTRDAANQLKSDSSASSNQINGVSMTRDGTGDPVDAQRRLNADANQLANRGIIVLENGFNSGKSFYVVVAVADDATVAYLSQHYGPVVIGEWLAPT
jgi:hypothetical protein